MAAVTSGPFNSTCISNVTTACPGGDAINTTSSAVVREISHLLRGAEDDEDVELYRATPAIVALLSGLYGLLSVAAILGNTLVTATNDKRNSLLTGPRSNFFKWSHMKSIYYYYYYYNYHYYY